MKTHSVLGLAMAATLAAATPCALAQGEAEKKMNKPAMPTPAAEMAKLSFFDGNWSCSGEGMMEPGGPKMKMTSTVTDMDLGGFWQSGTVKGTTPGMPPIVGNFHIGWDAAEKQYVMLWVDNMGAWSMERAPGWEGDKLVFVGDMRMGADKMRARDTFTRNADGSMTHQAEMEMGGSWTKMMEETCRKMGSPAKR
jgi:hypothetical protein